MSRTKTAATSPAGPAGPAGSAPTAAAEQPENLLRAIHVVSNRIGRAFAAEVTARHGLSIIDWRIILSLHEAPGQTARDITRAWGMEKMAVNRAARRLEEEGHLKSRPDANDARRLLLSLTPKGRALYRRIEPVATARYHEITAGLSAREKATLGRLLGKISDGTDSLTQL